MGTVAPAHASDPALLVVDEVGQMSAALRRALPLAGMRRAAADALEESGSDAALVVFASYGELDVRALDRIARVRRCVVVADPFRQPDALQALSLGALGYVDARDAHALARGIAGALRGEPAFGRAVLGQWLRERRVVSVAGSVRARSLTRRQREVVRLVASGASDKEIARQLGISEATAQRHVANVLRRLAVPNRAAAVAAVLAA